MKIQRRKRASWLIVFHIITRFTTSIECLRKIMKIVVEESWCKNLHHMLQKEYVLMLWDKTHIEFLCHILWGFTTTTNINENDAFIEDLQNLLKVSCYQSLSKGESLRMIFHEFSNKLMQKAYKFQSFSKLENGTFQWWVLSRLH